MLLTALFVFGAGCAPRAGEPPEPVTTIASTSSTTSPTTPTTGAAPTTTVPQSGFRFDKVDPKTLQPVPGTSPIFTGDTHGLLSANGRWLVLESWGEGRWLIDTESWEVASDFRPWGSLMEVRDDGTVYAVDWDPVWHIRRFRLEAADWEEVVIIEPTPELWNNAVFIDDHRLAARGYSEETYVDGEITVNLVDVASAIWTQIPVPGAWVPGEPTGIFLEETYQITTYYDPAMIFTEEKAFVVHAHEDVVSEVLLETGEVKRHELTPRASVLDSLLAWMAPPAVAKGPAPGVRRNAIVNQDGSKLYVSGYRTEISRDEEAAEASQRIVETTRPLGVQVIDTDSWHVEKILDLPIGTAYLSPDGSTLLGTGYTEDGIVSGGYWYRGSGVFAIDTDTYEVTHFDSDYEWETVIDFSADGSFAYLSEQFQVRVVDLDRREVVTQTTGDPPDQIWGAAGVISEWLGE